MNTNAETPPAGVQALADVAALEQRHRQVELGFATFATILERDVDVLRGLGWELTCALARNARVAPRKESSDDELGRLRTVVERQQMVIESERQALKELQIAIRDLANEHAGAPF